MLFKISEIKKVLKEISNDGYKKVDIMICDAEDDLPGRMCFSALEIDGSFVDYDDSDVEECEP